jgi:Putative metal-binding motif
VTLSDATSPDARVDGAAPDGAVGDVLSDIAAGDASGDGAVVTCGPREVCGNGLDDDCNGMTEDGCACIPGATQRCYAGPPGAAGRGACAFGTMRCEGDGEFGRWGACSGATAPSDERCDEVDNDCDGLTDEGFCRVGTVCVRDGEANPASLCQVCRAPEGASAATTWAPRAPGTVCRPAMGVCDLAETCDGAVCPPDAFSPASVVCRPAIGACDRPESCTGASNACPADVRAPAGTACRPAAGACDVAETCDGTVVDCPLDVLAPAGRVCRPSATIAACDPAEACTGRDATCPTDVVSRTPTAERCGNGVDDNCNGMTDEGCIPCISGMASSSPWQMHRLMGPVCFGRTFSQHGEAGEYAYASVPAEGDAGWRAVTSPTIDFAESSALCGRSCSCLDGGEFTYFQTFFDVSVGYAITSLSVTMAGVDDGARVTVYNAANPGGVVDAGSYILLGGTGVSTNLARFIVPGRNRIVITHLDDCCSDRSLSGVRVVVNGTALATCP